MKSKNLLAFLNILLITLQFVFIQINPVIFVNASTWTTYSLQDTYRDSYRVGINYYYDGVINPIQHSNWDCYDYVLFNYIIGNASWLKSAILSVPCYSASDYNGTDYATVYGLKNPSLAHLLTEPTTPVTTAFSNMFINADWINYKNVTVTTVVKEIMQLSNWTSGSSNICFKILEPFNVSQPDRYIYDYSAGLNISKLYLEFYEAGEKPYEGGWDFGDLNWTYPDYDQWIVWNGTEIELILLYDVTNTQWSCLVNGTEYLIADSSASSFGFNPNADQMIAIGSNWFVVLPVYDGATYDMRIYNSTDNGQTWSMDTEFQTGSTNPSCCLARYNESSEMIVIQYFDGSHCHHRTFNVITRALGIEKSTIGMIEGQNIIKINSDGSKWFCSGKKNNLLSANDWCLALSLDYGETWSYNYLFEVSPTYTYGMTALDIFEEEDGDTYAIYGGNWNYGSIHCKYMDKDMTFTVNDEEVSTYKRYHSPMVHMVSATEQHFLFNYVNSGAGNIYFRIRTGGKIGSYDTTGTVILYTSTIYPYDLFYTGSDYEVYYKKATNDFKLKTGFNNTWSSESDVDADQWSYLNKMLIGGVSANYTQRHWINCTWDDPYLPDGYILPDDDWTDPIIGDSNRIKLSVLLLGLFLITSGLGKFALGFRFEEIGVIIFVILIGVALLVSMPYIN